MKSPKVKLPIWKAYLYSLVKRYRRYLWINKGMLEFGMTRKETGILHGMIHKYLRKEVLRQVKSIQYHDLVSIVLGSHMAIATKQEIQVANKLLITHEIKTRSLIMEMKQLKAFAKEVGIDAKTMKKLDEDELILEIIKNLDSEATYSDEFIEWYEELPDEVFDDADAIDENPKGKKGKVVEEDEDNDDESDFSDLIEAIEEVSTLDELIEIAQDEDFEDIFAEVDTDEFKTVKKLKKAMLEAIEVFQEAEEEVTEEVVIEEPVVKSGKKGKAAAKVKEEETEEDDNADLIEAIKEAEETEELKEIADEVKEDDPELFKGISFRSGRGKSPYRDVDEVREEMLDRLIAKEEVEEEVIEEKEELEITAELVNDALEADDKESLVEMAEQLDIQLKILEKKSAKKMAEKILAALSKESKKTNKRGSKGTTKKAELVEEPIEAGEESKSLFQVIEEMVEEDASEKEIMKAVSPILEERGKKKLFITKFVKQMVEVVKSVQ